MKFLNVWIVALLVQLSVQHAVAQNKPDRIRIGYAARAVAHSVPFVAREAGLRFDRAICEGA